MKHARRRRTLLAHAFLYPYWEVGTDISGAGGWALAASLSLSRRFSTTSSAWPVKPIGARTTPTVCGLSPSSLHRGLAGRSPSQWSLCRDRRKPSSPLSAQQKSRRHNDLFIAAFTALAPSMDTLPRCWSLCPQERTSFLTSSFVDPDP